MTETASQFVTRDEFLQAFQQVSTAIKDLANKIDSISERRGSSARQIWLGVAGMLLALTLAGGSLVAFAVKGAVEPILVTQKLIADALVRDHVTLEATTGELASLRGRYDIIESMVLDDVRVDHGGGTGSALNQARIGQMEQRQTELWQLIETLDLKIQRLDRMVGREQ